MEDYHTEHASRRSVFEPEAMLELGHGFHRRLGLVGVALVSCGVLDIREETIPNRKILCFLETLAFPGCGKVRRH